MPGNIVLIGPRGSGKTTVGRILAERLRRVFVDTDELVCASASRSVHEIFAESGEAGFRRLEAEAVSRASRMEGVVIAAGGGAVEDSENVRALRETGVVVRLKARPLVLYARISADPASAAIRPPLTGLDPVQEMEVVVRRREPLYAAAAHVSVETGRKTPEQVADEVIRAAGLISSRLE